MEIRENWFDMIKKFRKRQSNNDNNNKVNNMSEKDKRDVWEELKKEYNSMPSR